MANSKNGGEMLNATKQKALSTWGAFSAGQRAVTVVAAITLVVGGFMFTKWSAHASYSPLFSNLDPTDAGAITDKLTSQKVGYKLTDGGRTILVPQAQVYQLRVDLSSKGLPTGGSVGYSILDKQGITTSEFRQRVDYQRAMEGELSRTISAINGVAGATVHLVIPKDDVFTTDTQKPTASVLVKVAPGARLTPENVQAIVHLVSSAVEGLAAQDVTVADDHGRLLSQPGDDGASMAEGDARAAQTHAYESDVATSVEDMLGQVMGQGHAVVQVTADLDYDHRETTTESYTPTTAPVLNESTSKENFTGTGQPVGGVLGPNAASIATTAGGNNTYAKEDASRQYAVGKVTEQVKSAPGAVKRLSVAVLLDAKVKGISTGNVQKLVTAAAGLDTTRGDTIAVDSMPFDTTAQKEADKAVSAAAAAKQRQGMLSMVKTLLVALLLIGAFMFFLRITKRAERRETLSLPELAALTAAAGALPSPAAASSSASALPALAGAEGDPPGPAPELALVGAAAKALPAVTIDDELGALIERQPEQVAQLLRGWLSDRRS
jgi:flagellar M-ring protein FliF